MKSKRKALLKSNECVACGCCTKICPMNAISIYKGMYALIDEKKCVGCGRCEAACPAQVISMVIKEAAAC